MPQFTVTVSETQIDVAHAEGHRFTFERKGNHLGPVVVTPNNDSKVFASSLEDEAEKAARNAVSLDERSPR
jgi:hypothetical protein